MRQTVKQFKQILHGYFGLAPTNMRLWYYDQEMSKLAGPEEMKFANKELYTYTVIDGDSFVIDEAKNQTRDPCKHTDRSNQNGTLI